MDSQILFIIIAILGGIIIGGAGGTALIRKVIKIPETPANEPVAASILAVTVAQTTAAAFRIELKEHMAALENQISQNNQRLTNLEIAVNRLAAACPEKHKAIDQRLAMLDRTMEK